METDRQYKYIFHQAGGRGFTIVRGFVNTQMGDVTKVLEAESLVTPLNLEPVKFEQNQYASFHLGDIFAGVKILHFLLRACPIHSVWKRAR